ncbi:MAG: DUF922 domain-containing protein [Anaerolineae bacterium]|nr:DUF922 domain-containing protein [Anaerolineae bacterium]
MPKQTHPTKTDSEKNNQAKTRPEITGSAVNFLAWSPLSHAGRGDGLSDPRLLVAQRRALAAHIGRVQGNQHLQRMLAPVQREGEPAEAIALQGGTPTPAAGAAGTAAGGGLQHATEQPYDVTGSTLDEVSPQLRHFDGQFAALSNTPLGLSTSQVTPQQQPNGSYRVTVTWAINGATVSLPRWQDYGQACQAAKTEWDRFMSRARQHEQTAHINAARNFVSGLEAADKVISGATVQELQQNLQAKQQDLAQRLQTIHDACDHGASIDAILHPDNGHCAEDSETADAAGI